MKIQKILNNNAVIALNEAREEVVVTGLGIAFQKKKGDPVALDKIERVFSTSKDEIPTRLKALMQEIPPIYIEITEQIVAMAKERQMVLNDNIFITLTDHLSFAIERIKKGIVIQNPMIWEVRRFYQEEYALGQEALELVQRTLNLSLPKHEAAAIAMHIVNARLNEQMPNVVTMMTIIQDLLTIIRYHFAIEFDESTVNYQRLLTHLKFFARRMMGGEMAEPTLDELFEMMKQQYEGSYLCVEKIKQYAKSSHEYDLSDSEMTYLMVHIERVVGNRPSNL